MDSTSLWISILAICPILSMGNVGVPVLLFRHESTTNAISKPLAGHTISTTEFSSLVTSFTRTDLTVTFLQDELSNEDFLRLGKDMKRGGLFKNVQKYSERKTSVFFPSVKAPSHSLKDLDDKYDELVELKDASKVLPYLTKTELQEDTAVVIHLVPTADEETSFKAIKQNDEIIGEVMGLLEKSGLSYVAFFTGKSHRRAHETVVVQGVGRHLLANVEAGPNNKFYYNDTNCMIYMESVKVDGTELSNDTVIKCSKGNTTMEISIGTDVTLTFSKDAFSMWNLASAKVKTEDVTGNPDISAPIGFSYHCNENTTFYVNTTLVLEITRIQVQVFVFDNPNVFGNAYDCTGFFTIGLWTGLLTALLLITATMYGMMMLSNIQTFDLYDDPKSKPLTITVSE